MANAAENRTPPSTRKSLFLRVWQPSQAEFRLALCDARKVEVGDVILGDRSGFQRKRG